MAGHDMNVIGASAGGIEALSRVLAQLPADLPAAIFVVQHIAATSPGWLHRALGRDCPLPVAPAQNGETIRPGQVYVAPPDHHLLIKDSHLHLSRGARENHTRPAIDPLFRSAAVAFGPRVIGVLLTGLLDDGSAGLLAIQRCGGKVIIQDPVDAAYPEMPSNALECVTADYCVSIAEMGSILVHWAQQPAGPARPAPEDLILEVNIADGMRSDEANEKLGELTPLTCLECTGPMWKMHEEAPERYRCRLGHAFTAKVLSVSLDEEVERTLWAALRAMEERADLYASMARRARRHQLGRMVKRYEEEAAESRAHAQQSRELLGGALTRRNAVS